jgi:hypothetical protein
MKPKSLSLRRFLTAIISLSSSSPHLGHLICLCPFGLNFSPHIGHRVPLSYLWLKFINFKLERSSFLTPMVNRFLRG